MNHLQLSRIRVCRTGGVLLALLLTAGFISTAAPIASVAGNTCKLSCCAGRAPHAAGSCLDGTCQAALRLRKKSKLHQHAPVDEKLCGSHLIRLKTYATVVDRRDKNENGQRASFHFSSFRQPCTLDCAGCAVFSMSKSQSKCAVLPVSNQLPAGRHKCLSASFDRTETLDVSCRQHSPRGPPDRFIV